MNTVNELASEFLHSGSSSDYVKMMKEINMQKYSELGKIFYSYFSKIYNNYKIYDLYNNDTLQKFPLIKNEDYDKLVSSKLKSLNLDQYNKPNTETIKPFSFPFVTFSITTCKRLALFEQTMNSFLNCCLDKHLISHWICVDDNSSEEDRKVMTEKYPFFDFVMKTPEEKGHAVSMNIILKKCKTPYLLHMEDDWKFFDRKNYITESLSVLSENEKFGQCLFNKNYAELISDFDSIKGGDNHITPDGIHYSIHSFCPTQELKESFAQKFGDGVLSCNYWPYYSLRPSVIKTSVLHQIGQYSTSDGHFEMEYANRYANSGYTSAFFNTVSCMHIGRLTSQRHNKDVENAYTLNDQLQFEKNINNIKTFVVNLDRRPDRMEKFKKNCPSSFIYERFPAIDGKVLKSSPQLQRIFDGNDYNMKIGMVGCALSHIQLCINLINSQHDNVYLILEDDILFAPKFVSKLNHVMKLANDTDWDMIYIGHHIYKHSITDATFNKTKYPELEKWSVSESATRSAGGTIGYLINKKGAIKLLEFINKYGMTNCIDTMQQKAIQEMNVYYCSTHLVTSTFFQSGEETDTDIQQDHTSLSQTIHSKISDLENAMDDTFPYLSSLQEVESYTGKDTIIYESKTDLPNTMNISCPYFTIDKKIVILNPKKYINRLKVDSRFDISEVLHE